MTLSVNYDGSYEDDQGERQYLPNNILKALQFMNEGQKVLIVEEEEKHPEEFRGSLGMEKRI